jgi:hypothetical protein
LISNATLVKKSAFVLNRLRSFCVDLSTELRHPAGVTNQSNYVERKRFWPQAMRVSMSGDLHLP